MTPGPSASIPDALRRAQLEVLWAAVRERLERSGGELGSSPLTLAGLQPDEVDAVCALLGRRRPDGSSVRVDLTRLDRVLREGPGVGLVDVVRQYGGPLRDRRGERERARSDRDELWSSLFDHPESSDPRIRSWVESLRRRGRLTRLGIAAANDQVVDALVVLGKLLGGTTAVRRPLPVVAARLTGDAHGLDPDRTLGVLVRDGLAHTLDHTGAVDERAAWAAVGVDLDPVGPATLALGIDADVDRSEPTWMTRRRLDRLALGHLAGQTVFVCENPAIVAVAADELGSRCAPLVCTSGMPGQTTQLLLERMVATGAEVAVHTDFDAGGMAIAAFVLGRTAAFPWRLSADDYLAALDHPSTELTGTVGPTPWDPELSSVMNRHRRAVHEEAIVDALLADLDEE